jgi:glutaredoxin
MIRRMNAGRWLILVAVLAATVANGQQYRWTDEKGRVHYTDTPPPPSAKNVQKKELKGNAVDTQPSYEMGRAQSSFPVTLYTHPVCKDPCQIARDVLNKRGIPFTEVSINDEAGAAEIRRLTGGRAVPVLKAGGLVERTASEAAYNRTLDMAGYPPAGTVKSRNQGPPAEGGQSSAR